MENHQLAAEKTVVIPPGVEIERFGFNRERTEGSLIHILFVGNDFVRKGGQELVEVFLNRFKDEAELHLVTNAPVKSQHPRIHVHAQVAPYSDEWFALYSKGDVFVLPTRGDATPNAVIEAMAAGLPIISTNDWGIPELVTDGETGFLIGPGDRDALARSLERLCKNPSLRRQMGAEARKIAEKRFSATRNFGRLEAVFVRAAESETRPASKRGDAVV